MKADVSHNLVGVHRLSGMSAQAAFDATGSMLDARYRDWSAALAATPSWGETVDREVQRYITCVKNLILANLNWR